MEKPNSQQGNQEKRLRLVLLVFLAAADRITLDDFRRLRVALNLRITFEVMGGTTAQI
jgi:hypothetical protein